jgi:hypothetical protein
MYSSSDALLFDSQKEVERDGVKTTTTTTHTATLSPVKRSTAQPAKSSTTTLERVLWAIIVIVVAIGVGTLFVPTPQRDRYWPISDSLAQILRYKLNFVMKEQPVAVNSLMDAFEYHDGRQTLSLHFVGNVSNTAKLAVQQISDALFGSPDSTRVLYLTTNNEDTLRAQIFKQLVTWPWSVLVIDADRISANQLDFLTSMLNDNFPHLQFHDNKVRTDQAVVILVSNKFAQLITDFALVDDNQPASGDSDTDSLDALVKNMMKKDGWPDRVCQRLRHTIPFVNVRK